MWNQVRSEFTVVTSPAISTASRSIVFISCMKAVKCEIFWVRQSALRSSGTAFSRWRICHDRFAALRKASFAVSFSARLFLLSAHGLCRYLLSRPSSTWFVRAHIKNGNTAIGINGLLLTEDWIMFKESPVILGAQRYSHLWNGNVVSQTYGMLCKERRNWDKKLTLRSFLSQIANLAVILIRDGMAYAILIAMFLRNEITVDEFVLYFAAISSFATWVGNIIGSWNSLHSTSLSVCDLREYLDFPEHDGTGEADIRDYLSSPPEIVFDKVCFRYENAESDTLHISI